MASEFVFFSSNPSLNHIKIEKCLLLIATNTNIFTLLFNELNTDGKSFIFAVCRLTYDHVTSNLISLLVNWDFVQVIDPLPMCCFRMWKTFQATPTKQDLVSLRGYFQFFWRASLFPSFLWGSPPGYATPSQNVDQTVFPRGPFKRQKIVDSVPT